MGWRGKGVIVLPSGRTFRLAPKGFWRSEWILADRDQNRLLSTRPNSAWGSVGASVEVENGALALPELPLLAILCWYAILQVSYESSEKDSAVAASMVASGAN